MQEVGRRNEYFGITIRITYSIVSGIGVWTEGGHAVVPGSLILPKVVDFALAACWLAVCLDYYVVAVV
jgi:hypothetical protein